MKKVLLTILLGTVVLGALAQKVKTVEGEFTYIVPDNVSLSDAKRYALQQAQLTAIGNEFGTIVAQTNLTRLQTIDGKTDMRLTSLGSSDVKGEWIETTGEPAYQYSVEDGQQVVVCKVKGKAREVVTSKTDFQARILRNGTEDRYEDDRFNDRDELYISFQSPVRGYLAIYLVDDDERVQCILPYSNQQNGIYQVEGNERYVLFSEKNRPQDQPDELIIDAERSEEHYQVYVIFSPNQFTKAVDNESRRSISGEGIGGYPRELSYEDFHKWLARCRRLDTDMCLKKTLLTIKK